MTTQDDNFLENNKQPPTHIISKRNWSGKRTEYESLGVAWEQDDGSLYIRLYGTQVIDRGFYAFPKKE